MMNAHRPQHARRAPRGFTLVELLVVLVVSTVLVGASLQLLDHQRKSVRTEALRVDVQQNARYAIDMLTRELQQAGQNLDATSEFGPVATVDGASGAPDTLYILYGDPDAPVHTLIDPNGNLNKIKIAITCQDPVTEIQPAKMMYVASGNLRGVAEVETTVKTNNGKACDASANANTVIGFVEVTITPIDQQKHGWIFKGNNAGAAAMVANAVVYYIDNSDPANPRLMRATDYQSGTWAGVPMADNISDLQVTLIFQNGATASVANPTDADAENDFDDINTVQVDLQVMARRTDKDLNQGKLYGRTYRLAVTPRNQMYTRNLE